MNSGGTLALSATGTGDRVADTTPILLSDGTLRFINNGANVNATETVGPVTFASGRSVLAVGNNSTGNANVTTALTLASLVRHNHALLWVRPNTNVAHANTPTVGPGNQVMVGGTAPVTLGGNASRATNHPVIPFITSQNASLPQPLGAGSSLTLTTYESGVGVRSLGASDFVSTTQLNSVAASLHGDGHDNLLVDASRTLGTTTVNAILFNANATLTIGSGNTLTVGSGVIAQNLGGFAGGVDAGILDLGGHEGVITSAGSFNVTPGLTNAQGLTVYSGSSGNVTLAGINTFAGRTSILGIGLTGGVPVGVVISHDNGANPSLNTNVGLPDTGDVLIHPGSTLTIGNTNVGRRTHEVVGSVSGVGSVRLGQITSSTVSNRSALIIGNGGTGDAGAVTLDGGSINPGMIDSLEIGTLSVTTAWSGGTSIPLVIKSGELHIDLGADGLSDLLAVTGSVTRVGTDPFNLVLEQVGSFSITEGDTWRILTAGVAMDPALTFSSIVSSVPGWEFVAYVGDSNTAIAGQGDLRAIWVTAVPEPGALVVVLAVGSVLIVRRCAGPVKPCRGAASASLQSLKPLEVELN